MGWCDIFSGIIAFIIFVLVLAFAISDGWWVLWFWFLLFIPFGGWGSYRYGPVWYPIIVQTVEGRSQTVEARSTDETTSDTEKTQLIF